MQHKISCSYTLMTSEERLHKQVFMEGSEGCGSWKMAQIGRKTSKKHPSTISSSGPTDSQYLTESHVLQTYVLPTNRNKEAMWAHLTLLSGLIDPPSSLRHSHHRLCFCVGTKMLIICGLSSYSTLALPQPFLTPVETYMMAYVVYKACADLSQIS